MKLKSKMIVLLLITFAILLVVPSMVNAATVEYTRTIPSNEGTIKLNFTGLTLDVAKAYEFALVRQGRTPENWFSIDDGYTETTATITLNSATSAITNVLKATDTGFIYIREKDDTTGTYILEAYQVNLKLPYLQSLAYGISGSSYTIGISKLYGAIGNSTSSSTNLYYKWELVENKDLVEKFLDIKNNDKDITEIETYLHEPPLSGYSNGAFVQHTNKNDGLYLLWVKRSGENCKDVYSCIVHDGLPEASTIGEYIGVLNGAPIVESVIGKGDSSNLTTIPGTTQLEFQPTVGDEITINVKFNQDIVKTTAPKLTIKFGSGSNIDLTTCEASSNTLTYKYTIKEGDLGSLEIVSFIGGNVTNNQGTPAVLTLPELSGTKVVAVDNNDDEDNEDTQNGEWTDFSKAKFTLKKNGTASAVLEITGVNPKNGSQYYLFITSKSGKPNVTSNSEDIIHLTYNQKGKKFSVYDMEEYIELNKDMYITIIEKQSYQNEKIVVSGKKLERYAEPKYSDAFFATFMTDKADQIVTTFTHSDKNNRKIQIKIGKITDVSILQKIKNKDASGFASLLSFAKSNKGIYDKLVDANKNYYTIAYDAGEGEKTGNSVIDLKGLENEAYYFLYIKAYDENGKYITQEAVTLAQADVYTNSWFLFFYGDEDFKWADFGDVEKDDTKAPNKLPATGKFTVMSILAVTVIAGAVSFIKTKKYRGI